MITGISGIGLPGIITNISAASLGGINGVDRVNKREVNPSSSGEIDASQIFQPIVDAVALGEETPEVGQAYGGQSANQLRNRGMALQLEHSSNEHSPNGHSPNERSEPKDDENPAVAADANADNSVHESGASAENDKKVTGEPLTDEEQQQVQKLKRRDLEVRTHEQAHLAASGGFANGGAKFEYQQGEDGKRYAIGGHVSIDTSPEATPEATIAKMRTVRQAALAPAEPSGQDRSVAASATSTMNEARRELATANDSTNAKSAETAAMENATVAAGEVEDETEISVAEVAGSMVAGLMEGAPRGSRSAEKNAESKVVSPDNSAANIEESVNNTRRQARNVSPVSQLSYNQMRGQMFYRIAG
ncbi:MAG: hypothetical protein LBP75_10030 [Planctomycetota bacterium]|jgi:hypothetical protein|nr:hypothetical protein [Planctomycetota bacterium]